MVRELDYARKLPEFFSSVQFRGLGPACPCPFRVVLGTATGTPAPNGSDASTSPGMLTSLLIDAGMLGVAPDAEQ